MGELNLKWVDNPFIKRAKKKSQLHPKKLKLNVKKQLQKNKRT